MIWQPIETAPKDGRQILAYLPYGRGYQAIVKWNHANNDWYVALEFQRPKPDNPSKMIPWITFRYALEPSHWMPLPEPPK